MFLEIRPPQQWQHTVYDKMFRTQELWPKSNSEYVNRNSYVDDGLNSYPTEDEALEIFQKTQTIPKEEGNVRFLEFASNSAFVMELQA